MRRASTDGMGRWGARLLPMLLVCSTAGDLIAQKAPHIFTDPEISVVVPLPAGVNQAEVTPAGARAAFQGPNALAAVLLTVRGPQPESAALVASIETGLKVHCANYRRARLKVRPSTSRRAPMVVDVAYTCAAEKDLGPRAGAARFLIFRNYVVTLLAETPGRRPGAALQAFVRGLSPRAPG